MKYLSCAFPSSQWSTLVLTACLAVPFSPFNTHPRPFRWRWCGHELGGMIARQSIDKAPEKIDTQSRHFPSTTFVPIAFSTLVANELRSTNTTFLHLRTEWVGSRIVLIDFLRGLCLVVMTIDHLPETLIRKFTFQGFGFFSAAELLCIFVGTGCRQSLWPYSNHQGDRYIAAASFAACGHPLPYKCRIGDLDDPCRWGRPCDIGARAPARLVPVEQAHALHCIPRLRRYPTNVLHLRPVAPGCVLGID